MKIDVQFDKLDLARRKLKAELKSHHFESAVLDDFASVESKLLTGIDIDLGDVDGSAGVFTYEGRQIVIYIKDHTNSPEVVSDSSAGNKVHFKDCRTIVTMKRRRRFDRYIATNRSDGLFLIDLENYYGGDDTECKLNPCQNCLKELNFQNFENMSYPDKKRLVSDFDYEAFLEEYSVFFENHPTHTDKSSLPSRYIEEWSNLSTRLRERNNWICEGCDVDCSSKGHRKLLHVHHINGVKSDNKPSNLKVLCLLCHAAEPHHSHMKISAENRTTLKKLRRQISN